MATRLDELLAQNQQIDEKRRELKLLQIDLWNEINPLLEEAEAERRAIPTPGAEQQTVG